MLIAKIAQVLAPHTPLDREELAALLEYPPNADMGDVALPCFTLSRTMRQSPQSIAQRLAEQISHPGLLAEAAGPYLNFRVDRALFAAELLDAARADAFRKPNIGEGERIVIDMSSPNIAKPFGIGHLRSTMIGNALYRILREVGFETVSVNHLGDWGTQFGKMIVAYRKWGEGLAIGGSDNPTKGYLELYVRFHREAEDHPELEDEARAWFKRLEDGDEEALEIWRDFIGESLKEFNRLYARLGVTFDHYLGESFYNDKMDAVVDRLGKQGLLEESDGAQVVRLDDSGMPPCLILKSDGTSIYATRDLATALYRRDVMGAAQLLYVVGGEQALHFRQVFEVLKKMGHDWAERCRHIPFGLMMMEGQKMSTRRGKVLFLEDVLNEAVEQALRLIEAKNPALPNKPAIAEAVGIGAVVFGDLKNTRTLDVNFSLQEVLNFDGETGPYLQYTYARTASILRKGATLRGDAGGGAGETDPAFGADGTGGVGGIGVSGEAGETEERDLTFGAEGTREASGADPAFHMAGTDPASGHNKAPAADYAIAGQAHTWELVVTLSKYPQRLHQTAERHEPSILARYLLELAQAFNRFYHHVKVLAGEKSEQAAKLQLVEAVGATLGRGLHLLGLQTPEEI